MSTPVEGDLLARKARFAIVASRYNEIITRRLIDGAVDCLMRHGAAEEQYRVFLCPGAWEIPLLAKSIAESGAYDAVICLAAVIRGETPHNEYIASEVAKGIAQTSLATGVPMPFGVLTTDSVEQAIERAGLKHGNKGWDAALSALEMVNLLAAVRRGV
ncbi:MAG: 6,7-dimethyl-8-ribityllumazine synthase [Bacteroidota bacterium]|nr:6,7-dimethyl-8-ribityllumazine synthase [Bacteroidota bacterium]